MVNRSDLGSDYIIYTIITPPTIIFAFLGFSLLYDWGKNFKSYKLHGHFFVLGALALGITLFFMQYSSFGILTDSLFAFMYSTVLVLFAFSMFIAPVSSAFTGTSPYKKNSSPRGIYVLPPSHSWEKAREGSLSIAHEEIESGVVSLSEDDGMLSIE